LQTHYGVGQGLPHFGIGLWNMFITLQHWEMVIFLQYGAMFVTMQHWRVYITLGHWVEFDTLWHLKMFLTLRCHDICITLRWRCIVHHIVTMRVSFSYCNNMAMLITLWLQGNAHHTWTKGMFITLWHCYACQNVTIPCLSECHIMDTFDPLGWCGYYCHIVIMMICSSNCDNEPMFVTLWKHVYFHPMWRWGYVHDIMMIGKCWSHCDVNMFFMWRYHI